MSGECAEEGAGLEVPEVNGVVVGPGEEEREVRVREEGDDFGLIVGEAASGQRKRRGGKLRKVRNTASRKPGVDDGARTSREAATYWNKGVIGRCTSPGRTASPAAIRSKHKTSL